MCKMQRPNHPYQECPKMKCYNCNGYGHNKWNCEKLICFKCQRKGHYSFECHKFNPVQQNMLITAHPGRTPEKLPTYSHPSRVPICSKEPAQIPPARPGTVDDAVDAIGEFMENYSSNLVELQERLDSLERREIDNKTTLQLTIVDADNERKRKIDVARMEYKKVKAAVEEEREDLMRRMKDGQAWETIKANFKMACRETVDKRKEEEEEREAEILEPFDEEILAEAEEQERNQDQDQEVIEDSDIVEDPEVTNTDADTNVELNIEIDQETEDLVNSESTSHSVWSRLSGYFRR